MAGRESYRSKVIFRFERVKMVVAFLQNRVKKDGKLGILWEFEVEIEIFEKLETLLPCVEVDIVHVKLINKHTAMNIVDHPKENWKLTQVAQKCKQFLTHC